MLFADVKEWHETIADLLQLSCVFLVCIFESLLCMHAVDVVARIDSDFLYVLCCHVCCGRVEMDVCYQWHIASKFSQTFLDELQIVGLFLTLGCKTYDFSTHVSDSFALLCRRFYIISVGVCHRLYADGVVSSDHHIAHMHFSRLSTAIFKNISHDYYKLSSLLICLACRSLFCSQTSFRGLLTDSDKDC